MQQYLETTPTEVISQPASLTGPEAKVEPSDVRAAKCGYCYHHNVDAVCQQCGRFLCHRCQRKWSHRLHQLFIRLFVDNPLAYLKPLSGKKLKRTVYCRDCHPPADSLLVNSVLIGLLLLLLALIISWPQPNRWLVGFLIGLAFGVILLVRIPTLHRLLRPSLRDYYGLPIFCKIKVEVVEELKAHYTITGGDYLSFSDPAQGNFKVNLALRPADRERIQSVLPATALANKRPVLFHAGFIALEQLKHIQFVRPRGRRVKQNLLLITRPMTLPHFIEACNLAQDVPLEDQQYEIQTRKTLQLDPPFSKEFPLLIKPRLVKGGRRLEIRLEITRDLKLAYLTGQDIPTDEIETGIFGKATLDKLELKVPKKWMVRNTNGQFDKTNWQVTWLKRTFNPNTPLLLYIEFQWPEASQTQEFIKPEAMVAETAPSNGAGPALGDNSPGKVSSADELDNLKGEYQITVENWTISQLYIARDRKASIIRPVNGTRLLSNDEEMQWLAPTVKYKTIFSGNLDIHLAYLFIQQVNAISDAAEERRPSQAKMSEIDILANQDELEDELYPGFISREELLVAPSYHVVNEIVDVLTRENVFIKRVRETPGHMIENDSGGFQVRYWEIRGRYYPGDRLQPVTLHLIIFGQVPRDNQPNCCGTLTFELSLRSYAKMEQDNQNAYQDLQERHILLKNSIKMAAYRGRQVDYHGRRINGWQQEQQLEDWLRQKYSLNQVAAIFTSTKEAPEIGRIFYTPISNADMVKGPSGWRPQDKRKLPQLLTFEANWIDKWELLRDIDLRMPSHGR